MKEQLIKYWERKERYIMNATRREEKQVFFSQAFGGLEFAMESLNNWDEEAELIELWNNEWKARLEDKVYEMR